MAIASAIVIILGIWNAHQAAAGIDPGLERVLSDFARGMDLKIDLQSSNIQNILKELTELKFSTCLLHAKLMASGVGGSTILTEYVLQDILEEQLRVVRETQKLFAERLGLIERSDSEKQNILRSLAIDVAANELSLTAIRQEVIPELFGKTNRFLEDVRSVDAKVEMLNSRYMADHKSLCDRLRELEEKVNRIEEEGVNRGSASIDAFGSSVLERRVPITPLNVPIYQPEAYVSTRELCPNATLLASGYTYHARVVPSQGQPFIDVMYGDVYRNCNGKIVMVIGPHAMR